MRKQNRTKSLKTTVTAAKVATILGGALFTLMPLATAHADSKLNPYLSNIVPEVNQIQTIKSTDSSAVFHYIPITWQRIWNWQGFSGKVDMKKIIWYEDNGVHQNGKLVWSNALINEAIFGNSKGEVSYGNWGVTIQNGEYALGAKTPTQYGTMPLGAQVVPDQFLLRNQSQNSRCIFSIGESTATNVKHWQGNMYKWNAYTVAPNIPVNVNPKWLVYAWMETPEGNVNYAVIYWKNDKINNLAQWNRLYATMKQWVDQNGGAEHLETGTHFGVQAMMDSNRYVINSDFQGVYLSISELFLSPQTTSTPPTGSTDGNGVDWPMFNDCSNVDGSFALNTLPPLGTKIPIENGPTLTSIYYPGGPA